MCTLYYLLLTMFFLNEINITHLVLADILPYEYCSKYYCTISEYI